MNKHNHSDKNNGSDDLNRIQESFRVELNPEKEDLLRAKLGEYQKRLKGALSQERIPSATLDSKIKVLILEELLKHKKIGGGDVAVSVINNEQVLDLALKIGARKKMNPAVLIAALAENALSVIKDYNDTGGLDVHDGALPTKGIPPVDLN